ncbi:MAG: hypothetical protein R3F61_29235 [Myxococcota bacterium]
MWTLLIPAALAYEVDAWAPYEEPIADSTERANATLDAWFGRAVAELRCDLPDDELKRHLARALMRASARRTRLRDRPFPRSLGYGRYSAWLETDPGIDRIETGTEGLFEDVGPLDSPVLSFAGAASSIRLAGIPVGTDKVDHFLATGFDYARWSRWGKNPERAVRFGTRTERLFLGRLTSKAFSYADLEANWAGYEFYAGLLGPGSPFVRGEDGCVERVRSWDWAEWVGSDWDELQNPSVYGPRVRRAVEEALLPDRDAVCEAWSHAEPDAERHVHGHVPPQTGPFGLDDLCPPDQSLSR